MPQNLVFRHNHLFFLGSLLSGEVLQPQPMQAIIQFYANIITVPTTSALGLLHSAASPGVTTSRDLPYLLSLGAASTFQSNLLVGDPSFFLPW
jgi:hypothetical protein